MKHTPVILLLAVLLSLFAACSQTESFDNEKFSPQKVGEYTRMFPLQRFDQVYSTEYQKQNAKIYYAVGSFKTGSEAQTQFDNKKTCDFPDLPKGIVPDVIKETALKDKTGKEAGRIRVCREPMNFTNTVVGDYKYSIVFTNENTFISVAAAQKGGLSELVKFSESLPFNSQIDLTASLQEVITANSTTGMSAQDLMKMNLPVTLAKEPYIIGKFLIVRQRPPSRNSTGDADQLIADFVTPSEYSLAPDQMASSYEEAGTIVRIDCSKGAKMTDYVSKDELKEKFPAYSVNCKISVIDKSIPAIIAQKDMVGTDLLETEILSVKDKEIRALEPREKITAFIKQLPRR